MTWGQDVRISQAAFYINLNGHAIIYEKIVDRILVWFQAAFSWTAIKWGESGRQFVSHLVGLQG
ncbi:hypothetical protein JCM14713_29000 [Desulfomicrobium salsuginis]